MFDPEAVETVLVDSYSTLVNEVSTGEALKEFTDNPDAIARIWYERSSIYGIAGTLLEEYRTTEKRHEVALDYALHHVDADVSESQRAEILESAEYDVFEDVRDGLKRLSEGGYDVYVLSNGDPKMLDELVRRAEIDEYVSDTISAAEVGLYKPDPRLYRHAARRVNTPIPAIAHVTASWYDIQGAVRTGMQAVWISRLGKKWEAILNEPQLKIDTLQEFAAELGI